MSIEIDGILILHANNVYNIEIKKVQTVIFIDL